MRGRLTGYESDMVATVAADLSIYADEDENSEVVAMAEKGESYDVVWKGRRQLDQGSSR